MLGIGQLTGFPYRTAGAKEGHGDTGPPDCKKCKKCPFLKRLSVWREKIPWYVFGNKRISERSVKHFLRSSMTQGRLNHCMILSIHKEKTDEINIINVAN